MMRNDGEYLELQKLGCNNKILEVYSDRLRGRTLCPLNIYVMRLIADSRTSVANPLLEAAILEEFNPTCKL